MIIRQWGINDIDHYIDDFVIIGPPKSDVCGQALGMTIRTCTNWKGTALHSLELR